MLTKPNDCTCHFPEVIARNMHGHALECPVYRRWAQEHIGVPPHQSTYPQCAICGRRLQPLHDPATGAVVAWRCVLESVDGQGVWWHA